MWCIYPLFLLSASPERLLKKWKKETQLRVFFDWLPTHTHIEQHEVALRCCSSSSSFLPPSFFSFCFLKQVVKNADITTNAAHNIFRSVKKTFENAFESTFCRSTANSRIKYVHAHAFIVHMRIVRIDMSKCSNSEWVYCLDFCFYIIFYRSNFEYTCIIRSKTVRAEMNSIISQKIMCSIYTIT